ncbi:hypothetical protein [Neorhodopirellula pilleata]|uniref:Uncharacterized protein n=1 Tax=Neorhodopirellula pilleata TaxID=2714738 RepID=A0A5C5ZWA2_9BACT|nr:hypothetical protein [Neorhodopirellula pilleata]TWT91430.1 hypothetical protein Pla100_52800 [Neorhodopirellula pilleata]TWT91479.1 hypothetical protein Pla100_53290 [Neorhodopirellula pilleata]
MQSRIHEDFKSIKANLDDGEFSGDRAIVVALQVVAESIATLNDSVVALHREVRSKGTVQDLDGIHSELVDAVSELRTLNAQVATQN